MFNDIAEKRRSHTQKIHRHNSRPKLINWINTAAPKMTLGFRSLKALYFVLHNLGIMNFWLSFLTFVLFITSFFDWISWTAERAPKSGECYEKFIWCHYRFMIQFAMFSHHHTFSLFCGFWNEIIGFRKKMSFEFVESFCFGPRMSLGSRKFHQ